MAQVVLRNMNRLQQDLGSQENL
uniref:Uncharacterized protein n=1 Tax=Rhizophora mucronata TaxID=61149 RepID=A0A2P2NQC4_RHIMU